MRRGHETPETPDGPVLEAEGLSRRFGGVQAVRDVALRLHRGEVLGVIGPNGSGKTTTINLLCGAIRPGKGSIKLLGREIARKPAHAVAALGVGRTFQNPRVFSTLTVLENMYVPVAHRASPAATRSMAARAHEWIELTGLGGFAHRVASELSGGQRKLVEFARVMVQRPVVVLMDEPFAGVHPAVKEALYAQIQHAARDLGTAFLVVSHEVPELVSLSDRFVCMAQGEVLVEGAPEEVCADPSVIEAYLGAPLEGAA
ncbi:ABC transporter ATP-binding protein [Thermopolyspora sp. NPDC052614]|uniref:ABC transporter ATP-binding protein n=1 Tax=Thermopolyspora sp. NPDC052614 TaxID=3155682 RepID=UPI00343BB530